MFTLKIKWYRYDDDKMVDESTVFLGADEIFVGGEIAIDDPMKSWEDGSYVDYRITERNKLNGEPTCTARLIHRVQGGKSTWYLASFAWLLGPDGKTIERLVP